MDKNTQLEQAFLEQTGVSVERLLVPFDDSDRPCGDFLKFTDVYSDIEKARLADDTSTPTGEWQHEKNTSNWDDVIELSVSALSRKTKDLQIAIWLVEAQLNKFGFAAIAPGFYFLHHFTARFWQHLHPEIADPVQDLPYRTNLIIWLNTKLNPTIKQLPITKTRSEHTYTWEDWERAAQFEHLNADQKKELGDDLIQISTLVSAVISTPMDFYETLFAELKSAIAAIKAYSAYFDELLADQSPPLNSIQGVLSMLYDTLHSHVKRRMSETSTDESVTIDDVPVQNSVPTTASGPIRNREEAYARLAEAADYLCMDDPHSPVPYLIYKAIEWGQLNTAELYQELFVQYQGQLNIFDILGLEVSQQAKRN